MFSLIKNEVQRGACPQVLGCYRSKAGLEGRHTIGLGGMTSVMYAILWAPNVTVVPTRGQKARIEQIHSIKWDRTTEWSGGLGAIKGSMES